MPEDMDEVTETAETHAETTEETDAESTEEAAPEPPAEDTVQAEPLPSAAEAPVAEEPSKPNVIAVIENHLGHLGEAIRNLKTTSAADFPTTVVAKVVTALENTATALGVELNKLKVSSDN